MSDNNVNLTPTPTGPPKTQLLLKETRALLDISSMGVSFVASFFEPKAKPNSAPIILMPGFASDERYLKPLQFYLQKLNYRCSDWGLGINLGGANLEHTLEDLSDVWDFDYPPNYNQFDYKGEGGVPYLCDQARAMVTEKVTDYSEPVVLIGWSLGGFIAREVARDLPHDVLQVITMGAPVIGGPKYTKAAKIFKANGQNLDWIETEVQKRDARPIQQPITAIYSKTDGVVNWQASIDKVSPNVTHIEVDAAHLGMGFNRKVWKIIAQALAQH